MKKLLSILTSIAVILAMMPGMAFAGEPEQINISDSLDFLKVNVYNKLNAGTYTVSETNISELNTNYYVNVGKVSDKVDTIQFGDFKIEKDKKFKLSVGNNAFIEDKAFYQDSSNNLYVATVLAAPHNSITINNTEYQLNISPSTTSLTASRIEKWNSGGDLTVTNVGNNACTIEASGNNVTGALYIGIPEADNNTLLITEKKYKNGSTAFGLTGTDAQTVDETTEYGLAFYPFGWGTDLTDSSNVTEYDGNTLNYSIYAVNKGVCNVKIDYKVGGVVAAVNGNKFTSLQDAFDNAGSGDTVKLLADYNDPGAADSYIVYEMTGKTLDLNGYTYMSNNFDHVFQGTGGVIRNGKMVCLNDGSYSLFVGDVGETNSFTVSDVTCVGGINVYNASNVVLRNVDVTGTKYYAVWCDVGGQVSIESGQFKSNGPAAIGIAEGDVDASLNIKGGIFTYPSEDKFLLSGDDREKPVITGGTFDSDISIYVPSGYYVSQFGGKYSVYRYVAPSAPVEKDPVTNEGTAGSDNAVTNADITDKVTTSEGKAEAVVDPSIGDKIVSKAEENKSSEVVIEAGTASGSAESTYVALPEATVKAISEQTDASVTINTDGGSVTLDKEAVDAVAKQAGTTGVVTLVVETVESTEDKVVVELKLMTSNGYVTDFNGGSVSVTVPVNNQLKDKEVVCVYIDDEGIYHEVSGKMNADGTYTFVTGHFSTYAIMAKEDADKAAADQTAAIKATTIRLKSTKGKGYVKLTWTKSGKYDLDGYDVYRGKTRTSLKRWGGTAKTTYRNAKSLKKGTTYYYKVRGYKVVDGKKIYTKWSNFNYRKAI